jgi:hypothetical protein
MRTQGAGGTLGVVTNRLQGGLVRFHRASSAGTLGVVCLATAMLMLEIAVVNTALLVGAALAAAGALASAALLTGLRNEPASSELAPNPA